MAWYWSLALVMGGFLALMLLGSHIVFAFFVVNIVGMFLLMGGVAGLEQMVVSVYDSLTVFVLLPITMFVLMGEVMFRSGVAHNMIDAIDKWLGRTPGRLSLLAVASGTVMSALSGASIGTTAMLGATLGPEMEKRGYHRSMSIGPIIGSGGLAIMIPPSSLGVILAVLAQVSVGKLLVAIIVPGLIMAALYFTYVILRCALNPRLTPQYDVVRVSLLTKLKLTVLYILPLSFIIFLVVGLMFLGVATPTEAAALGTAGSFLLAACYGKLSWGVVREALESTLRISVMVLVILGAAGAFSQILAFTQANKHVVAWAASLEITPLLLIIAMQVVVLVLGGFISGVPLMMITLPVFMPVVQQLGYDPIWFCVLLLINIEMAQSTPPYGILLFVMKGVSPPGTTLGQIIRAAVPFLICDAIAMGLIMGVPDIALWLPALMIN
jgi:tripartite ATP-independent transporter DctM subunit